ncbi:signal recognition particle-docking protein FtsY [Halostagnicola sp. A-GB9-2]|uniref:signal recognition particle-docking protein FtsY n=1 Tax=Halostagnicola sp. A-GB9-2 TaxID=3048066 RepID=UPI0024BF99AC|nr:signal recognition particle-docking protein FtsY [Halostagnicola sp. A-GB9-2]MDJ1432966.1 signal recognition particle-docking protein FtsY [Halostagnicola sp. A-GB9-2]
MFDNLKEKLGSFRKDAEEAAEENVEEVEEPAEDLADDAVAEGESETVAEADAGSETADTAASPDASEEPRTDTVNATQDGSSADSELESDVTTAEVSGGSATTSTTDTASIDEEPSDSSTGISSSSPSGTAGVTAGTETDEPVTADSDATGDAEASDTAETDEGSESDDNGSTGFGRKAKSLVRGKFVIEEEDLEAPLQELEFALLSSDVEMGVAEEILDNIRDELIGETRTFTTSTGDVVEEALRDAIYDVISVGQFDFDERIATEDKPIVIIFTGVNGVGKTTSIAKLDRYFEERGYSSVMANGDTYRAGANEQIREHAEARDSKLIAHDQGGDPAAVLYDAVEYAEANDIDVVLGDTAGRLHTDEGLMDQLEKIGRVVGPDMTLFVDEAVAGQDAVNRAREFDEAAEIDGAILTKADADSNGGAAISVAHVTGKPILFLGVGQEYDDLERFDPEEMADRLLEDE